MPLALGIGLLNMLMLRANIETFIARFDVAATINIRKVATMIGQTDRPTPGTGDIQYPRIAEEKKESSARPPTLRRNRFEQHAGISTTPFVRGHAVK